MTRKVSPFVCDNEGNITKLMACAIGEIQSRFLSGFTRDTLAKSKHM